MCLWRFPFSVALYSHCGHGNFCPSCTDLMCLWRCPFCVASWSHSGHWNFCPSCTDFLCLCRCPLDVNLFSQRVHWNVPWHDLICWRRFLLCLDLMLQVKHTMSFSIITNLKTNFYIITSWYLNGTKMKCEIKFCYKQRVKIRVYEWYFPIHGNVRIWVKAKCVFPFTRMQLLVLDVKLLCRIKLVIGSSDGYPPRKEN